MTISKTKKKFAFDVGWAFTSMMVILVLHFFQNPIMARFLGPDGLGLYSMVTLLAGIIGVIAGLGIHGAVVKYIAEYKDDVGRLHPLVSSSLITVITLGVTSSVILFIISDILASVFNMPSLSFLLKIYAFVFPFSLSYEVIIGFFNGLREMKYYSLINTLQGILTFSFILTFLFFGFGVKGAVVGNMFSFIVVAALSITLMRKIVQFTISSYKKNAKMLTKFGSKLMFTQEINVINNQADILLIGFFLTATDVGYYAVAVSLSRFFLRAPEAIHRVTYPTTSEYWKKNKFDSLNKMVVKSMKYSTCFLLIVGLGVWLFAKEIVVFLFGQAFYSAILPLQILIIGTVLFGIVKSIGGTLPAIGRPDLSLKISGVGAIANVVLNMALIPRFGIAGAAVATTSSFIIITALYIYFTIKLTRVTINAKWYGSAFAITLLAMAIFSSSSKWINTYFLGSLILCIYITVFFLFFLTKEDKKTFKDLIYSIIFKRFD